MSSERPRSQSAQAFAGAIHETRERAGLATREVAASADVELSTYEAIERGEGELELETIVRIAAALRVSAAELFERARL